MNADGRRVFGVPVALTLVQSVPRGSDVLQIVTCAQLHRFSVDPCLENQGQADVTVAPALFMRLGPFFR